MKEPMLAASLLDPEVEHTDAVVLAAMKQLRYPVIATLKKDGVRGLRLDGTVLSRTFKPIRNQLAIQDALVLPGGTDMELWSPLLEYNDVQSIVMSFRHPDWAKIEYHLLDWYRPDHPLMGYEERVDTLITKVQEITSFDFGKIVIPDLYWCYNADELFNFEQQVIERLGEGICFRTPNSPYKFGRSTLAEQWLVKLSRYIRTEATVVGFVEQMENGNVAHYSGVGKMDRSKALGNMIPKNTLGALVVTNDAGQTFPIGNGVKWTKKWRKYVWDHQKEFLGKRLTYKHKPHGALVLPRAPIAVGWREEGT